MHRQPSMVTHLRARWPIVLLLASIGVTAVAGLDTVRVSRSNRAVADRALREYASFAAWSYGQHLEAALWAMAREVVGAVNHGEALHTNPRVPTASDLPHYLPWNDRCYCHRPMYGPVPETFFGFEIGHGVLQSVVNPHPDPLEGWEVDRPLADSLVRDRFVGYSPSERAAVLETVRRDARAQSENGYAYLVLPLERGPRLVVYTLMPTIRGDTMIYGAQYTPAAIAKVMGWMMDDSELLPESFRAGRKNRELIAVAVTAPDGSAFFRSDTVAPSAPMATARLRPAYGAFVVQAAIRPEQVGSLLVGGLPRSRLPLLIGLLVLAAALMAVAVSQLRREAALARVRAEWIASVSHELRTPLAQIRLYQDTLRLGRTRTPEDQAWALAQVDRETTRLSHLVEKVLSFSRLGLVAGPAPQPTDLSAEARRIVEEFRPLAASRQVAIETAIADVPPVPLRRDALRHVLLNLLDNAVKYGPQGQTVRVELCRDDGKVLLAVGDQGPGVPGPEREAVWRAFARGSTGVDQGGSGIGLTIVREVAAQHGGGAWVEDAPGGGARFVVALPIDGVQS
ncbi:MAG: sensor histidine kinase [Gemmatimonadota bacterium]